MKKVKHSFTYLASPQTVALFRETMLDRSVWDVVDNDYDGDIQIWNSKHKVRVMFHTTEIHLGPFDSFTFEETLNGKAGWNKNEFSIERQGATIKLVKQPVNAPQINS